MELLLSPKNIRGRFMCDPAITNRFKTDKIKPLLLYDGGDARVSINVSEMGSLKGYGSE